MRWLSYKGHSDWSEFSYSVFQHDQQTTKSEHKYRQHFQSVCRLFHDYIEEVWPLSLVSKKEYKKQKY